MTLNVSNDEYNTIQTFLLSSFDKTRLYSVKKSSLYSLYNYLILCLKLGSKECDAFMGNIFCKTFLKIYVVGLNVSRDFVLVVSMQHKAFGNPYQENSAKLF